MPTDHRGTRELPMSKEGRLTRRDATQAAHDTQITSFSRRIFYVVKHVVKKDVRLYVVIRVVLICKLSKCYDYQSEYCVTV